MRGRLFAVSTLAVALMTACGTSPTGSDAMVTPGDAGSAQLMGCNIFPPDNPWNQDISALPVDPNSANYISSMSPTTGSSSRLGRLELPELR